MEFHVLGPLEVVHDGEPVMLGAGRQVLLLSCLLVHANEIVSRDLLIDALWGEQPTATAGNAVQVQVHALRKRLGQERIATEGPGYRLRVEPGELDLERFERLVAHGRSELASGEADAAARTLGEALALWRGPALADVVYEPFAQVEIARLEELRLAALEERIEAELALARHHDLVPELEALVSANPLRERLQRQLMLALYRSGRQPEALAVFQRARRTLRDELGLEPSPDLQTLQQAILRQDALLRIEPPEVRARRHLPAPQTGLIGRRHELDELGALVRGTGARLVTLTGAGGSGKTRIALQAAHELAEAFVDGVYFVDLAHLRDPGLVPSAIARALGIEERSDQSLTETLLASLGARRTLLLLDNFEVVDKAGPLLSELLAGAADLALLVTSRTPLRVSGEHEYRVRPLPVDDAVRLFAARARAVAPGFRRPSEEAEGVSEICQRLDCLPLAIELAAARTREYSPAELLELLPDALELASGGARDLPARQQTLRATIDWSYELLAPAERDVFARLAVFAGGCALPAAQAVCAARRTALASLVARSLLYERPNGGGPRFIMLETVRDYALERLQDSGDADVVHSRHAEHYVALAEAAEPELTGPGQRAWLELLEEEHDNLRAAISWSHAAGAVELELRLLAALARFWAIHGHLREGRSRLEAALEQGGSVPEALQARALAGAAWLAHCLGDYGQVKVLAEEGLDVYRSLGDQRGVARTLSRLGLAAGYQGDLAQGIALHKQCVTIYRELGDGHGLASSLTSLGSLLLMQGDYEQAAALNEESLALYEELGRRDGMPLSLCNLGLAALRQSRYAEALSRFRGGIELAHELAYTEMLIYCFVGLAAVHAATHEAEQAAILLGADEAIGETIGVTLEPLERGIREGTVEAVSSALGAEAFAAARATGRQLTVDDAVAYALGHPAVGVAAQTPAGTS
jgi:predicted ATPase/DNA-binding SARP family transcriptional activator